jgi:subtilase family serine protease
LLRAEAAAVTPVAVAVRAGLEVVALDSTGPTGLTPQQIRGAYGIDQIAFSDGAVTGDGSGQTIAIVDAYDDPNISSDLAEFDAEYGLPAPPSFTVDNLGASTTDAGWALETALDVEWAHAIAPGANIVLVEASSDSLAALLGAVGTASQLPGVSVVSMSWGATEFSGESAYDSVFTTPAGHNSVTYVAASGDSGAWSGPLYPSVSPNVLAVGGTTLTLGSGSSYGSETGWSSGTGGFSGTATLFRSYESEPSYQAATLQSVGLSDGMRTTPDVSFNADPSSGVSVYDSVGYEGQSGWFQLGGTSAAAPAWAGLIAIADQGLATGGQGPLSTTQALTDLYSLPSSDFHDITSGNNGYSATTGYDLVTGLGTPKANLVVAGLLAAQGVTGSGTTGSAATGTSSSSAGDVGTSTPTSTPTTPPTSNSQTASHAHSHHLKTRHAKISRAKVKQTKSSIPKAKRSWSKLISTLIGQE